MSGNDNPRCFLRCVEDSHTDLLLQHGKEVVLGRGPRTAIKDDKCSREHLKFVADCVDFSVEVTQVGHNSSFCNGERIGKGNKVTLYHDDTLNFLENKFEHKERKIHSICKHI